MSSSSPSPPPAFDAEVPFHIARDSVRMIHCDTITQISMFSICVFEFRDTTQDGWDLICRT